MTAPRLRRWSHLFLPGLIALLFVARCQGGFREDELECEQAANHLAKCCPGFDPTNLSCDYSDGCGTTYPALTVDESRCIENESCAMLVSTNVCPRAAVSIPIAEMDGGMTEHEEVCP